MIGFKTAGRGSTVNDSQDNRSWDIEMLNDARNMCNESNDQVIKLIMITVVILTVTTTSFLDIERLD